ncbi:hypothetical protein PUR71_23915 [Streptomyces sp. SP17BM10]|uniref:hypothetical protein n=1 Tax=Streptomyces sp. SP17BM10 TaxID=3002530 RepID=UPI002E79C6DC|nr:hypothetical protein [Streptomyces sp. SP17BM10]MEE1785923.1 hypothetical protein [Streptomyces sp. SP17BM10]
MRVLFEPGVVGTMLWPFDVESPYGYPAALDRLPISAGLVAELDELTVLFQSSIDWADPGGPAPWSVMERVEFQARARAALEALRRELGPEWTILGDAPAV